MYGWKFVRNQRTSGLPKESPNEVYWVIHLTPKDTRPATDRALLRVSSAQVVRKRRLSLISENGTSIRRSATFDNDELFCKRKHVVMTDTGKEERPLDAFSLPAAEIAEASFERLQEEDCDGKSQNVTAVENREVSSKKLRHVGVEKQHNGALSSDVAALSLHDNTHDEGTLATYTFADICCGAGGASRGAAMAGLKLLYSLDHDPAACDNYRLNFPQVRLYQDSLDSFVSKKGPNLEADIMHFSFPCQAYSQANTRPNLEKDVLNIAANMKLGACLDIAKHRIDRISMHLIWITVMANRCSSSLNRLIHGILTALNSHDLPVSLKPLNAFHKGIPIMTGHRNSNLHEGNTTATRHSDIQY
ncbi:MAG: hypothetical protein Q9198_010980 [Flavoplaca austrocitrina]